MQRQDQAVDPASPPRTMDVTKVTHHEWWHAPFAGVVGGLTGAMLTFPFEGAKKRAQSAQAQPWQIPGWYKNPFKFTREVYRGASAFAVSLGPVSMAQVTIQHALNAFFPGTSPYLMGLFSGAMGGCISAPVEHIIITQQMRKSGPADAIKYLFNKGITHPWTALTPLMIREAGFGFTYLIGAEAAGNWLSERAGKDLRFITSIFVGLLGAALTHPFDVNGTKKQMSAERISMLTATKQIYREKGLIGFGAGYFFRAFLFTGCMLSIGWTEKTTQKKLSEGAHLTLFRPLLPAKPEQAKEAILSDESLSSRKARPQ